MLLALSVEKYIWRQPASRLRARRWDRQATACETLQITLPATAAVPYLHRYVRAHSLWAGNSSITPGNAVVVGSLYSCILY